MVTVRVPAIAPLSVPLGTEPVLGRAPFGYREYALGSSVASVIEISGARVSDMKTLHERPARIQELEWRAPYVSLATELADPIRDVVFSFCDDQLFQIVVTYDRNRMEGLTSEDVVESVSGTYGVPLPADRQTIPTALPANVPTDATTVGRWEDAASLLTLTRGTYFPQFQPVLIAKTLNARAQMAIKEALRLDVVEAPQRELDRRKKDLEDARAAVATARITNKAAFKP